MDVFEKLNRKFGAWYEGLFGGSADGDLRPRDILRRILATMEDGRREGLDGQVYVPNVYILDIAVTDDEERQYLRTFLDADELSVAVRRYMDQHGYKAKGGLRFQINEVEALSVDDGAGRVRIRCRFDAAIAERPVGGAAVPAPEDVDDEPHAAPTVSPRALDDYGEDEEPGTVPAVALASLTVRLPGDRQEVYPVTARPLQIGRSRQAGNDIVLAGDGMVSKRHARIECTREGFVLYDLHSTNGSFVNEVPVEDRQILKDGDVIRVGRTALQFRVAGRQAGAAGAPPAAAARAPQAGARLVAPGGETYPLASEMVVGRALTSDIVLAAEEVAFEHAALRVRDDKVYVEDRDTAAGTFVNGERIPPRFPVVLYDGDTVGFGNVSLRLERSGRQ